ncbi:5-oxoprolinase subunit B family protein [Roseobacter sinensis]|uniref:Allophanate hydrolase subunit 1 n=1 Tax=Roseobacter sinensis TaxID=2931391 RepID=A0ABT3BCS2_9RHOB|nr:allophanate hydrolase subunit 1 [Roseobacter sp. WL0113]MCV3271366.1 allophanate hydrolase subunit 1 [Roseobacter sp. WL0113]
MSGTPTIARVGLTGLLVSFGDIMSEPANRAALAFRAAVEAEGWPEVSETMMTLVSVFVAVDLVTVPAEAVEERLRALLAEEDWFAAPLPAGRTLWHVPTVYGTDLAPQLEEAAGIAGLDPDEAIRQLSTARMRVLTLGFAPGQPYLGELPAVWDIPRQQGLTKSVPAGALVVAIRQLIIFTGPTPTGWRHVGQTAFRNFNQRAKMPFALSPGDELIFPAIERAAFDRLTATESYGAADREAIA